MKAPLLTLESVGGSRTESKTAQPAPRDVWARSSGTVSAHVQLNARRIRITFSGTDVAAFVRIGAAQMPGNWIKLFVPTPARGCVGRACTLRTLDLEDGTFDIDFVIRKTRAVSLWSQVAKIGDVITFTGPRDGSFNLLPNARRLLMIGDSTALSAIQSIMSYVPSDLPVEALIVVEHPTEYKTLAVGPHVRVNWIGSTEVAPGERGALEIAFNNLPAPLGPCQVWMAGESRPLVAARKLLSERWAMEDARIHSKIYWKRGTSHFQN